MKSDAELIDLLREIDDSDRDVTIWEAEFLDTVLVQTSLSEKQRMIANRMISQYLV